MELLSGNLAPLKEQYSNVDMFEHKVLQMLELDLFYRDVAERKEWISDKKIHRPTYSALTWVPTILFNFITDFIRTGCSITELTKTQFTYDSVASFRTGIKNLKKKIVFVDKGKIGQSMIFVFLEELRILLQTDSLIDQVLSSQNISVIDNGVNNNKYVIDITQSSDDEAV